MLEVFLPSAVTVEKLHGTWLLRRWSRITADHRMTLPFTERAAGRLTYDPDGWMNVFLMHPDWADNGNPGDFIAYAGRFEVSSGKVCHFVDASTIRSMIGSLQVRSATQVNGVLILEAPADDEIGAYHRLEWSARVL